jgi:hypothetical protein
MAKCEYGISSSSFSGPDDPSPVDHDDNFWSTRVVVVIAKPLFCIGMQHQDWESRVAHVAHTLISRMALSGKETAESHRVRLMIL